MRKLITFAFAIGLFLVGSQAKADWARQQEFAVETATIAFSSAALVVNAGETWYFGVSYSTGNNGSDFLAVYDSSVGYVTTTVLGYCAGQKKLEDYNFSASTTPLSSGVASTKWTERPIRLRKGLTVAPSVRTYNYITVFWAKPTEK